MNKYQKHYNLLMSSRFLLKEVREKSKTYHEWHHILPRSMGGVEDSSNYVLLTAREHYIAHWLLTKFTTGSDKYKMILGFSAMAMASNKRKLTSRQCSRIKELRSLEGFSKQHMINIAKANKNRATYLNLITKSYIKSEPELIDFYKDSPLFVSSSAKSYYVITYKEGYQEIVTSNIKLFSFENSISERHLLDKVGKGYIKSKGFKIDKIPILDFDIKDYKLLFNPYNHDLKSTINLIKNKLTSMNKGY